MTFAPSTASLLPNLPAVLYLVVLCVLLATLGRVPSWMHVGALVLAIPVRVWQSGWSEVALSAAVAAGLFVMLVGLAARTVSGVSLFSLCVSVALVPTAGWFGLGVGMLGAAVVALGRTWRHLGRDRVVWLATDTLSAMGVSSSGLLKPPEPGLVPRREALTDVTSESGSRQAARVRMFLPPWLLFGVVAGAATSLL